MFDEVVCAWTNICYDLKYVIEVALCDKMYVFYTIFRLFVNYVPEEVIIDLNILLQVWNVGHENHLHIYVKLYLDWYYQFNLDKDVRTLFFVILVLFERLRCSN